jgi:hypothetical protein
MIREDAKRQKAKPSRWLKIAFDTYQSKKYGVDNRKKNQAKGTHCRKVWPSRVALFASK